MAKNLIPYPYYETTKTQNGLTFTDNGDRTITINGIATDTATFCLIKENIDNEKLFKLNTWYTVSGTPAGGSISTYFMVWDTQCTDTGSGTTTLWDGNTNSLLIEVKKGSICDNIIFNPSIVQTYPDSYEDNRFKSLPSYHYENNISGHIVNSATDKLRNYTITGNGNNLFNQEKILSQQGWSKLEDGSWFYYKNSGDLRNKVLWKNTDGYTGRIKVLYNFKYGRSSSDYSDSEHFGALIAFKYTDGTTSNIWIGTHTFSANTWYSPNNAYVISNSSKTIDSIIWKYKDFSNPTWVKDIIITKDTSVSKYEPYNGVGDKTKNLLNPDEFEYDNPNITNNSGKLILNNLFDEDQSIVLANLINKNKNFIPYPFPYNDIYGEKNGITITDNGDGSITLNGTASDLVTVKLTDSNSYKLPAGKYYLSGNSSNIDTLSLTAKAIATDNTVLAFASDHGSGVILDITETAKQDNYQGISILIEVNKNTVLNNIVVTPQFKSVHDFATFTDTKYLFGVNIENNDYISHKFSLMKNGVVSETITSNVLDMTNRADIDNVKVELIINKNIEFNNTEVKPFLLSNEDTNNLLPQTYALNNQDNNKEKNGITYTINDDKSITLNGTATEDFYFNINTINDSENLLGNVGTLTLIQTNGFDAIKDYGCSTELNNKFIALQGQKLIFDFDISYEKGLFQGELYIPYKKTNGSNGWFGTYRSNYNVFNVPNNIQSVTKVSVRIRSNWSNKANHTNDNIPVTLSNVSLKAYNDDVFYLVPIKPSKYYLTGCPEGGSSDTYYLERQLYEDVNNRNKEKYIYGKNLLPYPYFQSLPITHMGITYTGNGDGGVAWSGTQTEQSEYIFAQNIKLDRTKTYTVSGAKDIYFKFFNDNTYVSSVHDYTHDYCTVDLTALTFEWDRIDICMNLNAYDSSIIYPMLVEGDKPADFEIYTKTLDVAKETGEGLLVDTTNMNNIMFGLRAVVKKGTTVTNLTFNPKLIYYDYEPYNKYKISIAKEKNLMFEDGLTEYYTMLKTDTKYKSLGYPSVYNNTYELLRYLKRHMKPNVTYILDKDFEGYEKDSEGMIVLYTSGKQIAKVGPFNGYKQVKFALTQENISNLSGIYIYGRKETAGLYKYIRLYNPNNPIEETIIYIDEPLVQGNVLDKITYGTDDIYLTKNKTSTILMQDNLIDFTLAAGSTNWIYTNIGYYVNDVNKVNGVPLWSNNDNYTGQIKILYKVKYAKSSIDATGVGEYIKVIYTDGTSSAIKLTGDYDADTWYIASDVTTENKTVKWLEWAYEDATNLAYVDDIMVTYDLTATEYKPCVKIYSEEEKNDNQLVVLTDVHPSSEVYQYYTY